MNLFALRYTDRQIGNFEMPASWLLSSESLYLILFAFPLAKLYQFLAKRKLDPTPPMKTALSLFAIGICFLIMSIGSSQIMSGSETASISPSYLFWSYGFMDHPLISKTLHRDARRCVVFVYWSGLLHGWHLGASDVKNQRYQLVLQHFRSSCFLCRRNPLIACEKTQ
jgi:hypothetical protein